MYSCTVSVYLLVVTDDMEASCILIWVMRNDVMMISHNKYHYTDKLNIARNFRLEKLDAFFAPFSHGQNLFSHST